jgi:hypothetical protein
MCNDDSNSLLPLIFYDGGRGTDKMVTVVFGRGMILTLNVLGVKRTKVS